MQFFFLISTFVLSWDGVYLHRVKVHGMFLVPQTHITVPSLKPQVKQTVECVGGREKKKTNGPLATGQGSMTVQNDYRKW